MKICDRCGEKAVDEIIIKSEDTHADVCAGCRQVVLLALQPNVTMEQEPRRRRGRPKNLEQSK